MTGIDQRVGAAAIADGSDPISPGSAATAIFGTTAIFGVPAIFGATQADPALKPASLRLRSVGGAGADESFRIMLAAEDGREILDFGPFGDDDAIAIWRSLAASTGLPMVIVGRDGRLYTPYDQIGRLMLGPLRQRRRFAPLSRRRPRFLIRRKSARLPRRPLVYREPELAGQEGR